MAVPGATNDGWADDVVTGIKVFIYHFTHTHHFQLGHFNLAISLALSTECSLLVLLGRHVGLGARVRGTPPCRPCLFFQTFLFFDVLLVGFGRGTARTAMST